MKACLFPGQGSQFVTMGADQFDKHPGLVENADEILGYSLKRLCAENPDNRLNNTAYTQPALFVVNHLMYLDHLEQTGQEPDFLAGHSLGEYNAVVAAGALDFEAALRLVKRRGELMAEVTDGGMLAVLGVTHEVVEAELTEFGLTGIDVANQNGPLQTILSGKKTDLSVAERRFADVANCRCIPLNVSGPFHSRYMSRARSDFDADLARAHFGPMRIEVVSNYTARSYGSRRPAELLSEQITNAVRWVDSIRYLMARGVDSFVQVGPGNVIDGLTRKIVAQCEPLPAIELESADEVTVEGSGDSSYTVSTGRARGRTVENLGSNAFKASFGLKFPYVAGGMYKAISSAEMVVAMARAGMLGVYGAGGVDLSEVRTAVRAIKSELTEGQPFAVNYISSPSAPDKEEAFVDLLLAEDVRLVEASAFMSATAPLVRYRASGLSRDGQGVVERKNRVMAKLSHPDVAQVFAQPPQERLVRQLVDNGAITAEQGELALLVPLADAITVEGNSGGHTDGGILEVLYPSIRRQVRELERERFGTESVFVGAAGGIGAPEAVAVAFLLGADYIVTGSINQCTVEAGTSDSVKDLLASVDIHDTRLSATGDMFELGSKIQVVRKGLFFPARANKLYELYRQYDSLEAIPGGVRKQLETKYFKRPIGAVYDDVTRHLSPEAFKRCTENPQAKMVAVFKWYFMMSTFAALSGDPDWRLDYQIQCGPSLGAFNRWVKGTELEDWRRRHVDAIAVTLLDAACDYLTNFYGEAGATAPGLDADSRPIHTGESRPRAERPILTGENA